MFIMKKVILFVVVLLSICSTAQVMVTPIYSSKFTISFKVPKETSIYKVTGAQITIHHEEQWESFKDFKNAAQRSKVLSFDGKSVGNTFKSMIRSELLGIDELVIKCEETNKTLRLKGVNFKNAQKKGSRFLTEVEYLSVK